MVEVANPTLSVRRQGELLGLNRSSYYYQAAPESALNLQLMRLVDEQFLRTPFYGWRKMTASLRRAGLRHQWQAGQTADAYDGHSSHLPQEKQQFSWQGTQALSLSFAQPADYPRQPGLERRHHLCTDASWLHVPGRCHRLPQSLCARRTAFQHAGRYFLSRCPAPGALQGSAPDLQHRPRRTVFGRCLHYRPVRSQHSGKHGRPRPRP